MHKATGGNSRNRIRGVFFLPFHDYITSFNASLPDLKASRVLTILASCIISWWIYVPVHELFHALGCSLGGGKASQLDLSPVYVAHFLKKFFPFISAGSDYAGRLTGFDTLNSDATYFLTVFFPYFLTIFIGVPMLRSAASGASSRMACCIRFGASLPLAYAPFISVTGDFYEIGSIVVTRIVSFLCPSFHVEAWRSDDVLKLSHQLFFSEGAFRVSDAAGVLLSLVFGLLSIYITYLTGRAWSGLVIKSRR
jgi:hypothetical protein